jgi:acetylornithine deacetylase/succinyl-diaminopimelate desuccinylase-like protein
MEEYIKENFYGSYLEGLREAIRIPSLSKAFDPHWKETGHLYRQCDHMASFVAAQDLQGCRISALKDEGRTPFLFVEVEGKSDYSVMFYGHMDKQPFGEGWRTSPTDPVIEGGKLYGRGSADDCYAVFSAVLAVKACQAMGKTHPRIVIAIEGAEEGGDTEDLQYYLT